MTALESEIRKVIVQYGYVKRLKEYPFPCLVIPKPLMDTLCERLAKFKHMNPDVERWKKNLDKKGGKKP